VRDHEAEQKLLDSYYAFKGWTCEGIPTKETLDKLSLHYVSEDFIKRGILTGNEGVCSQEPAAEPETKKEKGA
jgi:hypothetical protein